MAKGAVTSVRTKKGTQAERVVVDNHRLVLHERLCIGPDCALPPSPPAKGKRRQLSASSTSVVTWWSDDDVWSSGGWDGDASTADSLAIEGDGSETTVSVVATDGVGSLAEKLKLAEEVILKVDTILCLGACAACRSRFLGLRLLLRLVL